MRPNKKKVFAWALGVFFAIVTHHNSNSQTPIYRIQAGEEVNLPIVLNHEASIHVENGVNLTDNTNLEIVSAESILYKEGSQVKANNKHISRISEVNMNYTLNWITPSEGQLTGAVQKNEKFELGIALPETIIEKIRNFTDSLPGQKINPFNPSEVDIKAVYYRAENGAWERKVKRYGFYFEPFVYDTAGADPWDYAWEEVETENAFRIRFAPPEIGQWKVDVEVLLNQQSLGFKTLLFKVVDSSIPGWVTVDENHHYYKRDGEHYFPIGVNLPRPRCHHWFENGELIVSLPDCEFLGDEIEDWRGLNTNSLQSYDKYHDEIRTLKEKGGDYFRLMMMPTTFDIEFEKLGDYSDRMDMAWEMDRVIELVEDENMIINLCLTAGFEFARDPSNRFDWNWYPNDSVLRQGQWEYYDNDPGYCYHHALNIATPFDFLSDTVALQYYKRKYRYMFSRWMYSPAIAMVEPVNEFEVTFREGNENLIEGKRHEWIKLISEYAKDSLEYQGLLRVNYASTWDPNDIIEDFPEVFKLGSIDINSRNAYNNYVRKHTGLNEVQFEIENKEKPFDYSEVGESPAIRECDTLYTEYIKARWLYSFNGIPSSGMNWYWADEWLPSNNYGRWEHMGRLRNFIGDFDFMDFGKTQGSFSPDSSVEMVATYSSAGMAIGAITNNTWNYYTTGKNTAPCNVLPPPGGDARHEIFTKFPSFIPRSSNSQAGVSLKGFPPNQTFTQLWYNVFTGNFVHFQHSPSDSNGNLKLEFPTMDLHSSVLAFKVYPHNQLVQQPHIIESENNLLSNSGIKKLEGVKLFPNPATTNTTLDLNGLQGLKSIYLYNAAGKLMMVYATNLEKYSIPLTGYPSGRYSILVQHQQATFHLNLLKK